MGALLILIVVRGLSHFLQAAVLEANYVEHENRVLRVIGEIHKTETFPAAQLREAGYEVKADQAITRYLIKTGNRELFGTDFRWVLKQHLQNQHYPKNFMVVERREWGNFYGYLQAVKENGMVVSESAAAWERFAEMF
jgi:phosphate transport system permease protein